MIFVRNRTSFDFDFFDFSISRDREMISFFYFQIVKRIMNVNTSSLKIVVKTFKLTVQADIIIKNQKYIHFTKLHKMILITKLFYQNIIRCDMKFKIHLSKRTRKTLIKKFINDDFVKKFHKYEFEIAIAIAKNSHNKISKTTILSSMF